MRLRILQVHVCRVCRLAAARWRRKRVVSSYIGLKIAGLLLVHTTTTTTTRSCIEVHSVIWVSSYGGLRTGGNSSPVCGGVRSACNVLYTCVDIVRCLRYRQDRWRRQAATQASRHVPYGDRQCMSCRYTYQRTYALDILLRSAHSTVHDQLDDRKLSARWVPKNLKTSRVVPSCTWHATPIKRRNLCSAFLQGMKHGLITRNTEPTKESSMMWKTPVVCPVVGVQSKAIRKDGKL
jgi:hypothetical protein